MYSNVSHSAAHPTGTVSAASRNILNTNSSSNNSPPQFTVSPETTTFPVTADSVPTSSSSQQSHPPTENGVNLRFGGVGDQMSSIEAKLRRLKTPNIAGMLRRRSRGDDGEGGSSSQPPPLLSARNTRPTPPAGFTLAAPPNSASTAGCSTSPLPRRMMPNMSLTLASPRDSSVGPVTPRRRNYESEWTTTDNSIQHHRKSDAAESQRVFEEIMALNGKLRYKDGGKLKEFHLSSTSDLEPLQLLGNGTCGHVYKMRHKQTGKEMAVKQMRRTGSREENKRAIMDLKVVLRSHDCPYIVQCFGCFITDVEVWICMELMATCLEKLSKRLGRGMPEPILGKMTVSIISALKYLKEQRKVIHRDVKPSNILLDWNGTVKLCDFGISGQLIDSKAQTRAAGCMAYMAPERIDPKCELYDIRADVWSLGITLVELAQGRYPYPTDHSDFAMATTILENPPPSLKPEDGYSQMICHFVDRCLQKNYETRPKYDQLLKEPFIQYYRHERVDVAAWFRDVMGQTASASSTSC